MHCEQQTPTLIKELALTGKIDRRYSTNIDDYRFNSSIASAPGLERRDFTTFFAAPYANADWLILAANWLANYTADNERVRHVEQSGRPPSPRSRSLYSLSGGQRAAAHNTLLSHPRPCWVVLPEINDKGRHLIFPSDWT